MNVRLFVRCAQCAPFAGAAVGVPCVPTSSSSFTARPLPCILMCWLSGDISVELLLPNGRYFSRFQMASSVVEHRRGKKLDDCVRLRRQGKGF